MRIKNVIVHGVSLQAQCPEPSQTASQLEASAGDHSGICQDKASACLLCRHPIVPRECRLHGAGCGVRTVRGAGSARCGDKFTLLGTYLPGYLP